MRARLKQILLQQYIGAIVTAVLAAQALGGLVALVIMPITFRLVAEQERHPGGFGADSSLQFNWNDLIVGVVRVALQSALVFALIRWLYWHKPDSEQDEPVLDA